jgi:hypothetical protein
MCDPTRAADPPGGASGGQGDWWPFPADELEPENVGKNFCMPSAIGPKHSHIHHVDPLACVAVHIDRAER